MRGVDRYGLVDSSRPVPLVVKGRVLARNIGTSMYASERGRTVGTGAFQTESLPQPDPALQPCSVLPRGPCNADRPFLDGRAICRRAQRLACRYTCAMRGVHGFQRSMHREMPPPEAVSLTAERTPMDIDTAAAGCVSLQTTGCGLHTAKLGPGSGDHRMVSRSPILSASNPFPWRLYFSSTIPDAQK